MLTLSKDTVASILRWAERYPQIEVTGLVAQGKNGQRIQPMQNLARDPARYYEWCTKEMAEAWERMEARSEEPLAIYHSHPGGSATPSERDMEGALMVGMWHLIAYPCELPLERLQIRVGEVPVRPEYEVVWRLSAWECIDMGILVQGEYEVCHEA